MLLQFLPAVLASLVADPWPDEDDREEDPTFAWSKWTLKSLFQYTTGQFVFVRDIGSAVTQPFFGFSVTPLESFWEQVTRLPGQAQKALEAGELSGPSAVSFYKRSAQVAGTAVGVPGTNQITRIADYLWKWSQGELKEEPETIVEGAYKAVFLGDR